MIVCRFCNEEMLSEHGPMLQMEASIHVKSYHPEEWDKSPRPRSINYFLTEAIRKKNHLTLIQGGKA